MDRTPVQSSNVASVGYDPATQTLEVEFHGGGIYQYAGVSQAVYTALMLADSKGRYVQNVIKPAYRATKVSPAR